MLTYLAIFLSIALLLGVFIHRAVALKGEKNEVVKEVKEEVKEEVEEKVKVKKKDVQEASDLCERGVNLVNIGKEDEALKCFVRALSLDPNNLEIKYHLGMLYLSKEMYSAAAALFKELSELDDDPVHFSHLGYALYKQSDYPAAADSYKKAIVLDDSRPQRFVSLAQVYRDMGHPYHALIALDKALNLNDQDIEILLLAADLFLEVERPEEALPSLNLVLEIDPDNVEAKEMKKVLLKQNLPQ